MAKQDQGPPLPKFGEWDVNNPAAAEGYTVIFTKAREEKKGAGAAGKRTNAKNKSSQGKNDVKKKFFCF